MSRFKKWGRIIVPKIRPRGIIIVPLEEYIPLPNGQLATLADEETRLASRGEIDIELVVNGYVLRLRALVMDKLTAVCFGGTNFHKDNRITAEICGGSIMLHGQYTISQSNPLINIESFPPSRIRENNSILCQLKTDDQVVHQVEEVQDEEVVIADMWDSIDKDKYKVEAGQFLRSRTVNIASRQTALPGEIIPIQVHESCAGLNRIAVVPSFEKMSEIEWPPQVCPINNGYAQYLNLSSFQPISHPKHSHFGTIPVNEIPLSAVGKSSKSPKVPESPMVLEKMMQEIKIDEKKLSSDQMARLREIHTRKMLMMVISGGDITREGEGMKLSSPSKRTANPHH